MKKFVVGLLFLINLLVLAPDVCAADYSKISTNQKITSALSALETINRRDVITLLQGRNATGKPIRVMFRDLNVYGYTDCEAVTIKTKNNGLVIYISNEHRSASVECIACLIAHESQHHTFTNSKAEELKAWISETQAWNEFIKRDKELVLKNEPLVKREKYLARVRARSGIQGVQKLIAQNPVYSKLN